MRATASGWIVGPISLSTSRWIGEFGKPASTMPMSPPIDVPTQCSVAAFSRAMRVTMSATYVDTW